MIRNYILALLLLLVVLLAGCQSDLQQGYVESMQATHKAVMLDVKEGLYKPDVLSKGTLKKWGQANADAEAALRAEGKWQEARP